MSIATGTKLGRYEILSQIGVGGIGEVYLAEHTKLARRVALKVLPEEVAAKRERMARFAREAKAAAALNHPNIAHIYVDNIWTRPTDGGTPKQLTRFTSEYIFGYAPSADGKQLAVSRGTSMADVILIKDFR